MASKSSPKDRVDVVPFTKWPFTSWPPTAPQGAAIICLGWLILEQAPWENGDPVRHTNPQKRLGFLTCRGTLVADRESYGDLRFTKPAYTQKRSTC